MVDEDDYFDEDDAPPAPATAAVDDDDPLEAYMREMEGGASSKSASKPAAPAAAAPDGSESDDPLDSFMADLDKKGPAKPAAPKVGKALVQQCDEAEDPVASFMEHQAAEAAAAGSDDEAAGGGSGLLRKQLKGQKGGVASLAEVDHDAVKYAPFYKEFYAAHPTIRVMSEADVATYRAELNLSCTGFDVPAPIKLFEHAGLSRELMSAVRRHGYEVPTPIQCQALPVALSGRDLIGVAATGSGKSAAFLLPMVRARASPQLGDYN